MWYHIGNVCYIVVYNVHILIFQVQNQISTVQKSAQLCFCVYQQIARCTVHDECLFNENK